jgi:serine protease inhibitor ecotin
LIPIPTASCLGTFPQFADTLPIVLYSGSQVEIRYQYITALGVSESIYLG